MSAVVEVSWVHPRWEVTSESRAPYYTQPSWNEGNSTFSKGLTLFLLQAASVGGHIWVETGVDAALVSVHDCSAVQGAANVLEGWSVRAHWRCGAKCWGYRGADSGVILSQKACACGCWAWTYAWAMAHCHSAHPKPIICFSKKMFNVRIWIFLNFFKILSIPLNAGPSQIEHVNSAKASLGHATGIGCH